jgi:hypothetical protein
MTETKYKSELTGSVTAQRRLQHFFFRRSVGILALALVVGLVVATVAVCVRQRREAAMAEFVTSLETRIPVRENCELTIPPSLAELVRSLETPIPVRENCELTIPVSKHGHHARE